VGPFDGTQNDPRPRRSGVLARTPDRAQGHHLALIYRGLDEFVDSVTTYVRQGLSADEPVFVMASRPKIEGLRDALGDDARSVEFADAEAGYKPQVRATFECLGYIEQQQGRRSRLVAEQVLGRRTPVEVEDYLRMESAANVVYQPYPVEILCPYDASALRPGLVEACRRTHAELLDDDGVRASGQFVDPPRFISGTTSVPKPPTSAPSMTCHTAADLPAARHFAQAELRRAGLPEPVADDVVLAVSELLSNALTHGRPPVGLSIYTEDLAGGNPVLACHVDDTGHAPVDPLAGYAPPRDLGVHGRGLWMARQLCDSVQLSADHTGTHVRALSLL
jgi:anti-sigma regulatory factor (Ser/Thr protein kinase)